MTRDAEQYATEVYYRAGTDPERLEHALTVGRMLRELNCPAPVVTAGILHDLTLDTDQSIEEIQQRFGPETTDMLLPLIEDRSISGYRERKQELRAAVTEAGHAVLIIYAAALADEVDVATVDGELPGASSSSTTNARLSCSSPPASERRMSQSCRR